MNFFLAIARRFIEFDGDPPQHERFVRLRVVDFDRLFVNFAAVTLSDELALTY